MKPDTTKADTSKADKSKRNKERIEFRVSEQEKAMFDRARSLRGFKSLSEFARTAITKESKNILDEEKLILKSKRDKHIFFEALMSVNQEPSEKLLSAINSYNTLIEE